MCLWGEKVTWMSVISVYVVFVYVGRDSEHCRSPLESVGVCIVCVAF